MIAGLSPSSCCGVTPFNVSTPTSNPPLANARKKNTTAYTKNIRAPNTIRAAPLRKDCSLDIVYSLVLTTLRGVGLQVHLLVLDRAPQPLNEHVVDPTPLAIHADRHAVCLEPLGEVRVGELPRFNRSSQHGLCLLSVAVCRRLPPVSATRASCEASC